MDEELYGTIQFGEVLPQQPKMVENIITVSRKNRSFVEESIAKKSVEAIPGIGSQIKTSLNQQKELTIPISIENAEQIVGFYLLTNRQDQILKQWLVNNYQVPPKFANVITDAISNWVHNRI